MHKFVFVVSITFLSFSLPHCESMINKNVVWPKQSFDDYDKLVSINDDLSLNFYEEIQQKCHLMLATLFLEYKLTAIVLNLLVFRVGLCFYVTAERNYCGICNVFALLSKIASHNVVLCQIQISRATPLSVLHSSDLSIFVDTNSHLWSR